MGGFWEERGLHGSRRILYHETLRSIWVRWRLEGLFEDYL